MGRKCAYPECKSTEGLHSLPSNREMAHRWLQALGRLDVPTASVYVCNLHFTRESFSNYAEVEMGFKKQLLLKPDALPTPAKAGTQVSGAPCAGNVRSVVERLPSTVLRARLRTRTCGQSAWCRTGLMNQSGVFPSK